MFDVASHLENFLVTLAQDDCNVALLDGAWVCHRD